MRTCEKCGSNLLDATAECPICQMPAGGAHLSEAPRTVERDAKGWPFAIIALLAIAFVWWNYQEHRAQRRRSQGIRQALAEQTKKYRVLESHLLDRFRPRSIHLLGELPAEFDVIAVGGDNSKRRIDLGHPAHKEFGIIDVIANHPERPIVLVVTAYDPMIWRIGRTQETVITAVIASGYHTQVVFLPNSDRVPIASSTHDEYGEFQNFRVYQPDDPELLTADRVTRDLTGKSISRFYTNPDDSNVVYVGAPPTTDSPAIMLSDELFAQRVKERTAEFRQQGIRPE